MRWGRWTAGASTAVLAMLAVGCGDRAPQPSAEVVAVDAAVGENYRFTVGAVIRDAGAPVQVEPPPAGQIVPAAAIAIPKR